MKTINWRIAVTCWLVILCSLSNVKSQRTPTIANISPKQIKNIGGSVELSCSVQYNLDYPVLWSKIDKSRIHDPVPISSGTTPIMRDSRFSLRYDIASSTYTLQIKDIQETDAGYYRCQILIGLNNKITSEVELQVRQQPVILENTTKSMVTTENQLVKLECYASGYPTPKISWTRENNAILPTGGSVYRGNILKIPSITRDDRGTYYCEADNGVGNSVRRNVAVDVEFPPIVTSPKISVGQAPSYDIDLECKIEAFPSPIISWFKDDTQLSHNQRYSLLHSTTVQELTHSILTVKSIDYKQYGTYICRASNKLGQSEVKIDLYETSDPVCPPACKGTSQNLNTILFLSFLILSFFMNTNISIA